MGKLSLYICNPSLVPHSHSHSQKTDNFGRFRHLAVRHETQSLALVSNFRSTSKYPHDLNHSLQSTSHELLHLLQQVPFVKIPFVPQSEFQPVFHLEMFGTQCLPPPSQQVQLKYSRVGSLGQPMLLE